jgi:hypothetical protein
MLGLGLLWKYTTKIEACMRASLITCGVFSNRLIIFYAVDGLSSDEAGERYCRILR